MKIYKSLMFGALALAACTVLPACQDDIDAPAFNVPVANIKPNTSIYDLKLEYWDDATNYIKQIGTKENGEHIIIAGRVITSDYSGNIFKSLTIQDETAALTFSLNAYSLYMRFRIGQEVVVDMTDLYIGKYNGLQQIGYPEWYEQGNAWEATFMAPEIFYEHAQLNGLPEPSKVIVHTVNSLADIPMNPEGLCQWQSQLIRMNNITFVPQVNSTTQETVYTFGIYHENFNQKVREASGQEYTLRTSGYSDFFYHTMPTEAGDLKCLLSYYGSAWQLMIIDYADLMNFGNPTLPEGSENNPYSVDAAVEIENRGETPQGWVQGYIVGTVAPEVTTVTSDADIEWGADATLMNTVVIGATPDSKTLSQCLVMSLPQGSVMRDYVALAKHPENLGKTLAVYGTLDKYMGTFGVVGVTGNASHFRLQDVEIQGGGETPGDGNGTEATPYNCAQIIAMAPASTTDAVESGVWVSGYIVGYYQDYDAHFEVATSQRANILMSDVANPTDKAQCICVQLVASTATRDALNLVDNPGNLGKRASVCGDVMKYNTLPGIKNTSDYKLEGGSTPDTPTTGGATPSGAGTEASPYNAAKALEVAKALTADEQVADVYVKGVVYNISELSTSYGNATYTIVDKGYTETFSIYRGYYLNGEKFTSADQLKVGDEVVIKGTIVNYKGNTPQMTTGSQLVSINGGDTPDTPGTPDTPDTPTGDYKGDFDSFNGGEPKQSPYGTYTNATGWTAENSIIVAGNNDPNTNSNPNFGFIGTATTIAPVLNGKTSAPGKLTSPTLTGGIQTLTFSYGYPFSGSAYQFTVNIKQNGTVVKTKTVTDSAPEKYKAYSFSMDVNVSGDFVIEIVNDCPNAKDSNADRVAFWNLTWN